MKQRRKNWQLGFLGFLGFNGIPEILTQDWFGALWLLWFLWFLWFMPEKHHGRTPENFKKKFLLGAK